MIYFKDNENENIFLENKMKQPQMERRSNKRHKILWRITQNDGELIGYISDISEKGARVNLIKPITQENCIEFLIDPYNSISLPKVPIKAEVKWKIENDTPYTGTLGVKFKYESKRQYSNMKKLLAYINDKSKDGSN